ncbi:MAG: GHKL domain-containing protein [Colwellia sp.]|nr:GHKL domain-containing protein [Colwellia sp.]
MINGKSFEAQLTRLSLLASLPLFILLIPIMIYAAISVYIILLTFLLSTITLIYCHVRIYQKSAYQFRSLSNLLDAMAQGDYSLRARSRDNNSALDELVTTINNLSQRLNDQRIKSVESQLLLQTVINHIDVAIVALDDENTIQLINPAAQKLLQLSSATSKDIAKDVPTDVLLQLKSAVIGQSKVMPLNFGDQQGKFTVHVEEFRESGKQHKLLFITDVSTMLRSEERNAWQSLVRVISHEINNSLAPISSISQTSKRLLSRQDDLEKHRTNLVEGLTIISQRTQSLREFVNSYKQIANLPKPKKRLTSLIQLFEKIIPLFKQNNITLLSKEDISLSIDPIQIEQVLINLIKNAIESQTINSDVEAITVSWKINKYKLKISICDQGTGINNPDNLFVPFYTTKKQGSGIGLILCRQISEAHDGQLTLKNRTDRSGCEAILTLPLFEN